MLDFYVHIHNATNIHAQYVGLITVYVYGPILVSCILHILESLHYIISENCRGSNALVNSEGIMIAHLSVNIFHRQFYSYTRQ